ncbi:iron uptake transporter permease EfeU [Subtercola frigoramans]|uniref:High-affinity iron transporter n=1 Tax=Subtercola frigoramans TaxID=120298 RepID=A0ABS2L3Q9_9MICO|nr:iron uptake transporter permease EfeU [Subtercola frigoramans]MBM7471743.1 high-affinity iron transporter [Subtercola frigoramans]
MLATFVIGLREGLEAALIVGIIAAFLKRNGHSLKSMWVGVGAALVLSLAVGIILEVISVGLPQAQQEAMESIIAAVAVVMVTGMIIWMSKHARHMRSELESTAGRALGNGSVLALSGMAFLAVLREGFETSVFLLAAFQSSVSPLAAGLGAVVGILVSVGIGYAIYRGGVKLDLGKFFTVTGVFLVFVAAGLVMSALRTAHEAGWITLGQQTTVDLEWLAPAGSVQAALLTGVLGIPSDPRVIEVLGWALYLVPVLLFVLWPRTLRPGLNAYRLQLGLAAGLAAVALILAVAVPMPASPSAAGETTTGTTTTGTTTTGSAPIVAADGQALGSAQLVTSDGVLALQSTVSGVQSTTILDASASEPGTHLGLDARSWSVTSNADVTGLSTSLTLEQLAALNGGRTPVGINRALNPGPFDATWTVAVTDQVWVAGETLLDASSQSVTTVTLSGGGLASARTVAVASADAASADTAPGSLAWAVDSTHSEAVATTVTDWLSAADEAALFKYYLPLALLLAASVLAAFGLRGLRSARRVRSVAGNEARLHSLPDPLSLPEQQSAPERQSPPEYARSVQNQELHLHDA